MQKGWRDKMTHQSSEKPQRWAGLETAVEGPLGIFWPSSGGHFELWTFSTYDADHTLFKTPLWKLFMGVYEHLRQDSFTTQYVAAMLVSVCFSPASGTTLEGSKSAPPDR